MPHAEVAGEDKLQSVAGWLGAETVFAIANGYRYPIACRGTSEAVIRGGPSAPNLVLRSSLESGDAIETDCLRQAFNISKLI